jgi:arginase family enzyme
MPGRYWRHCEARIDVIAKQPHALPLQAGEIVTTGTLTAALSINTDQNQSHANTEEALRKILSAGAMPLILGGDHSIASPVLKAYDQNGPIHVVQIDAHLDFVDERHGGFLYYEVLEFLAGLAENGNVKGMDLVEVSPPRDQTGVTSILAAQVLMNAVGRIFYKYKVTPCYFCSLLHGKSVGLK